MTHLPLGLINIQPEHRFILLDTYATSSRESADMAYGHFVARARVHYNVGGISCPNGLKFLLSSSPNSFK